MHILRYETFSEQELLSRLKRTRLRGHGQPEIYGAASLELVRQADPESLAPAQRYVLQPDLDTVLDLYETFLPRGIDIFALCGGLLFWRDEQEGAIPLIPPMVEESLEPDGRRVLLINDGIHRVYCARKLGRKINVVAARGVPAEYPYYAYALQHGWSEVTELAELPDAFQKKEYRDPLNYKALFRDFNAVLPGVQKQRKRSNPDHIRPGAD
ncbi:MAG: hypothetical protein IT158_27310 [Bryobacterales bacterium]|nr:hypothetical protein [Bryobacterales bacterium]